MTASRQRYRPTVLAKWFINRVDREAGDTITHLKLQKLLYYAQAWHLANTGEPLFDEEIQAWTHGPVVPSVWRAYREKRWEPLELVDRLPDLNKYTQNYLDRVFQVYGGFTAKRLELMTHNEDPWKEARGDLPLEASCQNVISHDTMRRYYRKRISGNAA